jgi:chaperonin GroES
MTIKPLGDRVLLKPELTPPKTPGGIILPEMAIKKTQEGLVVAIGEDKEIKLKVGDRVIYDKYAGVPLDVEGKEMLLMKHSDIIAKLEVEDVSLSSPLL